MSEEPENKRVKVDLNELASTAWNHYRNYLDSTEEHDDGGEGDFDELEEIIDLCRPHNIQPYSNENNNLLLPTAALGGDAETVHVWLPLLLSVAHYHLADVAIGNYLLKESRQEHPNDPAECIHHLTQSLKYYRYNAGAWSMGANFGRMSKLLSVEHVYQWYQQAVKCASPLRTEGLSVLYDEDYVMGIKEWVELLVLHQMTGVEFFSEDDDDDEDSKEANEDPENDIDVGEADDRLPAENESGYSASAVEATSRFMCAMLASTTNRHDEAKEQLQHFDLTHRIHPNVWTSEALSNGTKADLETSDAKDAGLSAPVVFRPEEGLIPKELYGSLTRLFAPDASFWIESDYNSRGYYSFFSELKDDGSKPSNCIDQLVVECLLPLAKQSLPKAVADSIVGYEWWPHTRPVQANLGHNLHFDTDESLLAETGDITHPIVSSVLYLTGGADSGATIVFDQTPDSKDIAKHGWKSRPQDNSYLLFPGNMLHGVLPCPGKQNNKDPSSQSNSNDNPSDLLEQWIKKDSREEQSDETLNRLTFMVGFWTRNVPEQMKHRTLYGPCGPIPSATDAAWVKQSQDLAVSNLTKAHPNHDTKPLTVPNVSPMWEALPPRKEEEADDDKNNDPTALDIPASIDHRFFVKDPPGCFRQSLFEDDACE